MKKVFQYIKDKFANSKYPFQDRLYFLFGTMGVISAGAAFVAAIISSLPMVAVVSIFISFCIISAIVVISMFLKDIKIARIICSVFLNFFMFPSLFWVTGGANCGMVFYFIIGLCVATLILNGKTRVIIITLALTFDCFILYMGFEHPELAYALSYEERQMDTVSSFLIVALFVVSVIMIMSLEYKKEHDVVASYNETLKQQVITDMMTTLYNQNFLLITLDEYVEECNASDKKMSVAMFDIDDFKKVNDTYGHLRGNQVLCQFSSILKEISGEKNIATRYGGEEFLVVLPDTELSGAYDFAENIRLAVLNNKAIQELTEMRFSVSGGVAEYQKGITADEFVHIADTRLYSAKRSGKNRIVSK